MCAFGTLGDMLYYLSHKVFKISYKVDDKLDNVLKYVKYAVFIFIFILVWSMQEFDVSIFSPWDAFGSLFTFSGVPDFQYVITEMTIGFLLLLAIMAGSLFIERFFCRYLCPLGAVLAITSHLKLLRIRKPSNDCGTCKACTKKCAMGISINQMNTVNSGECINCMKCVAICPRSNANVTVVNAITNPTLIGAFVVAAIAGIYYIGTFVSDDKVTTKTLQTTPIVSVDTSHLYADGTYEGSGIGFRGATTTVAVTIEGDVITGIDVLSFGDDRRFFYSAFNSIVDQVISTQSTEVDAVSGATYSSNGIMNAVAGALSSAKTN